MLYFFAGRVLLQLFLNDPSAAAMDTGICCAWPVGWTVAAVMSFNFYRNGPWKAAQTAEV